MDRAATLILATIGLAVYAACIAGSLIASAAIDCNDSCAGDRPGVMDGACICMRNDGTIYKPERQP